MLAVVIADREAPDMEWRERVVGAGDIDGAASSAIARVSSLKIEPKLVNAERVAVEHPVGDGQVGMVRICGAADGSGRNPAATPSTGSRRC